MCPLWNALPKAWGLQVSCCSLFVTTTHWHAASILTPSITKEFTALNGAAINDSPTMANYDAMRSHTPLLSRTGAHIPGAPVPPVASPEVTYSRTISTNIPPWSTEILMVTRYVTQQWDPWWRSKQSIRQRSPKLRNMDTVPAPNLFRRLRSFRTYN